MHRIINDEILTIIRTMLSNIEVQNKENGTDYATDIKNPEGKEVIVAKEHEELYKELLSFRELFTYKNEQRNQFTYKDQDGKELGIYLPQSIDGANTGLLDVITDKFDSIESKMEKTNFPNEESKKNIKTQIDNYKAILSERNKNEIKKDISIKAMSASAPTANNNTQPTTQTNTPATPAPANTTQNTSRKRKVVKKETFIDRIKSGTIGRINAVDTPRNWTDFKKAVGSNLLNFATKFVLPIGAGALAITAVVEGVKAIAGIGTIAVGGGAAALVPLIPPLVTLGSVAALIACSAKYMKYRKKRKQDLIDAEQEEQDFLNGNNNTQTNNGPTQAQSNTQTNNGPTQTQNNTPTQNTQNQGVPTQNNPTPSSPTPNPASQNNQIQPSGQSGQTNDADVDMVKIIKDKKQQVIDTKKALDIENQKDSSDPIVAASQELASTVHDKSKYEFARIILENIDVQSIEQDLNEDTQSLGGR